MQGHLLLILCQLAIIGGTVNYFKTVTEDSVRRSYLAFINLAVFMTIFIVLEVNYQY